MEQSAARYPRDNSKKSKLRRTITNLVVAFGALALVVVLAVAFKPATVTPLDSTDTQSTLATQPALPARLTIPAIAVDAPIQHVGLTDDGTNEMDVPSNFTDVGWYKYGVRPGLPGSAVIAGHYNGRNVDEAIFYDLHRLDAGDHVIVTDADGNEAIFVVTAVTSYDYNAPSTEVFVSNDGKTRLNLITCGGEWLPGEQIYDQRTVVFTEQL